METQQNSVTEKLTGRVKWFNTKAGYGFVTVSDGKHSGTDVFVHHSNINVDSQQYKYLVQGEYVEFDLMHLENGKHQWLASNVSGIRGGKLMCETRRESMMSRNEYKSTKTTDIDADKMPRQRNVERTKPREERVKARGEGPRDTEKREWTLVSNKSNDPSVKKSQNQKYSKPKQNSTIITIESK